MPAADPAVASVHGLTKRFAGQPAPALDAVSMAIAGAG
eukprot:gene14424-18251_t